MHPETEVKAYLSSHSGLSKDLLVESGWYTRKETYLEAAVREE